MPRLMDSEIRLRDEMERAVYDVLQNDHAVKLLIRSIHASGCDFDIRRHISCEFCPTEGMNGGYDSRNNQVVICTNKRMASKTVAKTLGHELVHMFDKCRSDIDFSNMRHLACTEVRAANLFHCKRVSSTGSGELHSTCVANRAAKSIELLKRIPFDDALDVVQSVFRPCYNDLEPFGRRFTNDDDDKTLIFEARRNYGYY